MRPLPTRRFRPRPLDGPVRYTREEFGAIPCNETRAAATNLMVNTPSPSEKTPSEFSRLAIVTGVVALWMSAGWILRLSANAYLLLGIPLLFIFQTRVARRPLLEVWFARPRRFSLPWWGWLAAAGFMMQPIHSLLTWKNPGLDVQLWLVSAALGAIPLAWSLAICTRAQWRQLAMCLLTVGAVAALTLAIGYLVRAHAAWTPTARLLEGLRSLALYLPVCFMIEEVFFRGGLDSYLTRGGNRLPWFSAFYLSALWGWWHLPTVALQPEHKVAQLAVLALALPLVHCGIGALFSFFWRRSGLLLVPVFAHAFIDAVRNALQ